MHLPHWQQRANHRKNPHGYTRIRILITVDEPIEGIERARAVSKAICAAIPLPVDPNTFKPAQPAHGSTNHVEPPYINLDAPPLDVRQIAGNLYDQALDDLLRETASKLPTVQLTGTRAEAYASATLNNELARLASAPHGERNRTLYSVAQHLFSYALGGWNGITEAGVQADLEAIVSQWDNLPKSLSTIKSGRKHATPKPLELPEKPHTNADTTTPKPFELPTVAADLTVDLRYLDQLPTDADVIAVQSDVGTGKTRLMIQEAQRATSAIYLAPRERLAENFSREASRSGIAVEHYKDLSKADRRRPARTAFCVNSYSALADELPGLPVPELLELDEFEQLLDHVYGEAGTFDGREAIDAAEALKFVIQRAKRVLAMDAHLSPLAIDYLKAQGRTAQTVVNQHVTERGSLIIHKKRDGAISAGRALVLADDGVIAFADASAHHAATVAADLVELLGSSADVLLLTAENSGGERQSAFFADPNGQIGRYRAIVYSPVIGTGFDITAPVRAVVGVMGAHLSAYDARQMIGRCRNTQETHVYLPNTSGDLEENPAEIEALERGKAARTLEQLNADGVRVPVEIDEAQQNYLYWHARVMARRNASINHLREHFISLCTGYTISYSEHTDPDLTAKLEAINIALTDQRKAQVLTAQPLDNDAFEKLRDLGKVDESAIAGNLRYKIENTAGVEISPAVRDALWTQQQRRALRNYTDLIDDITELKLFDAQEQIDGKPLPKRKHRTNRRIVGNAFLRALTDDDGQLLTLPKDDLETALAPLIERYSTDLRLYFGWRPDQCKTAAATARRVLRTFGLTLDSSQPTISGQKVRVYQLNRETCEQMHSLAVQRRAMLQRLRATALEAPLNLKTHISGVTTGDVGFKVIPATNPPKPPSYAAAHLESGRLE